MLKAGVAKIDITPSVGVRMAGFEGRAFAALAVHDPLWARALVLDDGKRRVALVALDICGVSEEVVATVREAASSCWSVSPDGLLVAATHTHSGPRETGEEGSDEERSYWSSLPSRLADVVGEAVAGLEPARIGTSSGWSAVGMNRRQRIHGGGVWLGRNPLGPFDTELGVVRVDRADGTPLAGVLNYACHALCLADHNYLLSADYPGYAVHFLEERLGGGATGIFFNGACGDIDPREYWEGYGFASSSGFPQAERSGRDLAMRAMRVWDSTEMTDDVTLHVGRRQVHLPTDPARNRGGRGGSRPDREGRHRAPEGMVALCDLAGPAPSRESGATPSAHPADGQRPGDRRDPGVERRPPDSGGVAGRGLLRARHDRQG